MKEALGTPEGKDRARAVLGCSAGADVVFLGEGDPAQLAAALAAVGPDRESPQFVGSVSEQLSDLARVTASGSHAPLVVAATDLELAVPALLDLLDRPGVATAALVGEPTPAASTLAPARVGRDGRLVESVGSPAHVVTSPTHVLPGILRIAARDRPRAAVLLARAAAVATPDWGHDGAAAATLALVRGGVAVQASALGPFDWKRGVDRAVGAPGDPWQQRLRGASRIGDGFYSTYAVRPISRRMTAVGLAHSWSPNVVTLASLTLGLAAALCVATGQRWAWVVGAVLLQAALVVDCVDGEIARFTRRFSAFGAWLDGVGDRVKEYAVFAALAVVAERQGAPGWPLGVAAMAVVTFRHLEDFAYHERLQPSRQSRPDLLPVEAPRDLGPAAGPKGFRPAAGRAQRAVFWAKKVVHMPIAERYLVLSLGLLTFRPALVLVVLLLAVSVALLWTEGGRTLRVLTGQDPWWNEVPRGFGHLDDQLDLGPLARALGRRIRLPVAVGFGGAGLLLLGPFFALRDGRAGLAITSAILGAIMLGVGTARPLHHPLAWQLPALLWVAEALTASALVWRGGSPGGAAGGAVFAYLAAVAYHRYDVLYRLREGLPTASWVCRANLGVDGRIVTLVLVGSLAPDQAQRALWLGAAALAIVFGVESRQAWSAARRRQDPSVSEVLAEPLR